MSDNSARLVDYHVAAVCEQGHLETSRVGEDITDVVPMSTYCDECNHNEGEDGHEPVGLPSRCGRCGSCILTECPNCHSPIRGEHRKYGFRSSVDSYCWNCGEAYPWTVIQQTAVFDMLDLIEGFDEGERQKLRNSFPDLISDTSREGVAALLWANAIGKLQSSTMEIVRDTLKAILAERILILIGLG